MLIGYARVSTHDQNLDLQQDALKEVGCERVIIDTISGAASARPGLTQLKDILRAGDTLVVWRLDRLGRSLKDLIAWVGWLEERKIGLRSLHEAIDTTTPAGKLMGWMAPAPIGVAMRHNADVDICLQEEPPNASYHNRP